MTEVPKYQSIPPRADAQSDLLDAIIWWTQRYIDDNCDLDDGFDVNKHKAREAFKAVFHVEVLQALRGTANSMFQLKIRIREDV